MHVPHHKPNHFTARTRVAVAVAALTCAFYAFAGLAIGYVYIPAKRGMGIMLSGIPTLIVALATAMLCLASVLVLVDHYDRRPNEYSYKNARSRLSKAAIALFVLAPLIEVVGRLWFPGISYTGFAAHYAVDQEMVRPFASVLETLQHGVIPVMAIGLVLGIAGYIADRLDPGPPTRPTLVCYSIVMLAFAAAGMLAVADDLASGSTSVGRSRHRIVLSAHQHTAQFNAVLLAKGSLFGVMALLGLGGVALAMRPGKR
jgi:hypothetical protein